jgi:beta-fructofuranosidase
VTFTLPAHWVWDFWLADDGDQFHMFYLHAPKSLGDPQLRHRNARIGHATSSDLRVWTDHGEVLRPGHPEGFDGSATWTGCVVPDQRGTWTMFYTGSRFLAPTTNANIETIGIATSPDLQTWTKLPGPVSHADGGWYETLGSSDWPEEAWRDPWVYPDPDDTRWHMLVTARASEGELHDRGVIGHAISDDLVTWSPAAPLSAPGAGFAHLEVPQIVEIDGRLVLLFSCDTAHLAARRRPRGGGIWSVEIDSIRGPFAVEDATLLVSEELYSGRLIRDRAGVWQMLAFRNTTTEGDFLGVLTDPMPVGWTADGGPLALLTTSEEAHAY